MLDDLRRIFGERLVSFVGYGHPAQQFAPSLALVTALELDDLTACARHASAWHGASAATPLLLTRAEFARSADAFPIEYAEMDETAVVVYGDNPFAVEGHVKLDDLRRACEVQVRSHLLHLREDYVECGGKPSDVAALVSESAAGFAILLRHLARLEGSPASTPGELAAFVASRTAIEARLIDDLLALANPSTRADVNAARLFPEYLAAVANLAQLVDAWRGRRAEARATAITAP